MTWLPRFVTLLFGIGIGCLLFGVSRKATRVVLVSTLALWAFEPNLSAFSGIAGADLPVAFFFLASVLAFQKFLETPGVRRSLIAGFLVGMAVTSKFSALVLIPIFILLQYLEIRREKHRRWTGKRRMETIFGWLCGTGAFAIWIFILYLPGTLLLKEHRVPWIYFLAGLKNIMAYSDFHHPTYFWGEGSRHNHWLYFPCAFLLKSTVPFLILIFTGLFAAWKKKMTLPSWIWISALCAFLCVIPVQNLGARYLLPVYPFLIILAGKACGAISEGFFGLEKRAGRLLVGGLILWHATSVLVSFPHMIGYFNDFIPAGKKLFYLGDSNLDFGQDVKSLANVGIERGWKNVKLAQYGGINPEFYGLHWTLWTEKDLAGPQPGNVYVVNTNFMQLGPVFYPDMIPIATGWIRERHPTGKIGDTWYYFEIPGRHQPDSSPSLPSVQMGQNHAPEEEGKKQAEPSDLE